METAGYHDLATSGTSLSVTALTEQHLLPQVKGGPGGPETPGRDGLLRGKDGLFLPHRLQGTLPGPTHPPIRAGREAGDSESASPACPTAGDQVVTALASVWKKAQEVAAPLWLPENCHSPAVQMDVRWGFQGNQS